MLKTTLGEFCAQFRGHGKDADEVLGSVQRYMETLKTRDEVAEFLAPALSQYVRTLVRGQVRGVEQADRAKALGKMLACYLEKIAIPGEGYVVHGEASPEQLLSWAAMLRRSD